MAGILEYLLGIVGIACYGAASVLGVLTLVRPSRTRERWVLRLIGLGAVPLVLILIAHGVRDGGLPTFTRFEFLTCYALALSAAYGDMALRRHLRGLSGLLVPFATAILILGIPALHRAGAVDGGPEGWWLGVHVLSALIGYALFSLAGVLALLYLVQDYNLKHKRTGRTLDMFPALETLDQLIGRQIGFAFFMLTASIVTGVLLIHLVDGGLEWIVDTKTIAVAATWLVYAVLIHLRTSEKRHGKTIATVTLIGFACVLFAFGGVHLVADSVHRFPGSEGPATP